MGVTLDDVLVAAVSLDGGTAAAIAERLRDLELLGPAQDGGAICVHLADLHELGLLADGGISARRRRWVVTDDGLITAAEIVLRRTAEVCV